MHDPKRIPEIIKSLEQVWQANPELRLGQLLTIAIRPNTPCPGVFYAEDKDTLQGLMAFETRKQSKKLFLDDIRTIDMVYDASVTYDFDIVRTYAQFVAYIKTNGLPDFISFDNDLGLDETGNVGPDGYAAAKWLVYESGLDLKDLKFKVHSANPVAAEQIKGLLNNYIKHLRSI